MRFLNYVEDRDLPALYSGAECFVLPSIREGFGLPILEAQSCGTPVACANTSSLPEVARESALYFNPLDEQDIADKIFEIYSSKAMAEKLVRLGLENVKEFTWRKTAEKTLEYLEQAGSAACRN